MKTHPGSAASAFLWSRGLLHRVGDQRLILDDGLGVTIQVVDLGISGISSAGRQESGRSRQRGSTACCTAGRTRGCRGGGVRARYTPKYGSLIWFS